MPRYAIQAPDGKTYQIDGPPGATDDQVRAEVMRQNPHLGAAPPAAAAPAPGVMDQAMQRPSGGVGDVMRGMGEVALQGATGFAGTMAGGIRGILNQGEGWQEKADKNAELADSLTYSPRSGSGKMLSEALAKVGEIPARVGNRVQDDATRAGHPAVGAGANMAIQIAPAAAGALLGARGSKPAPVPRGATPRPAGSAGFAKPPVPTSPVQVGEVGVVTRAKDKVTKAGGKNIADRVVRDMGGTPEDRVALIDALRNAEGPVKDFKPTSAQAVAHMPEGSPLQALEDTVSTQTGARQGAPSTRFGVRKEGQATAIENAKVVRNERAKPARDKVMRMADETSMRFRQLGTQIANRYASKASALQNKGQIDTFAAQQERRGTTKFSGAGRVESTGDRFRKARQLTNADDAKAASAEMDPIIKKRQSELAAAEREMAELKATGANPLSIDQAQRKIDGIMATPGLRASVTVEKAMELVSERLNKKAGPDGSIAAEDLYMMRKEMGSYIETAAKESANWDKKLTAGLQRDLQRAIDDSIEEAIGNTGEWRAYLRDYSQRSAKIDMARDMQERVKNPLQRSTVNDSDHVNAQTSTGLPNLLDQRAAIANAILKAAGKGKAADMTRELAAMGLNPEMMARALEGRVPTAPPKAGAPKPSSPTTRAAVGAALAPDEKKKKK